MKTLTIGNVTLENRYLLAPMAGVSDLPFRILCHRQGAGMTGMEMISAKAILYKNKNTKQLMEISPEEGAVSLQLFGSDPQIMADMARQIEELDFQILDINMGCPVPKVVNNGEGSALMKQPLLVGQIVEAVSSAVKKPVTVKIRAGFDESCINAVEIAHIAQESGAAAVAVHGRTRQQYYSGEADWEIIGQVKDALHIPVLGNGDIRCPQDAARMMEQTGCDGVLIGRAARGNPWIFRDMVCYEQTGEVPPKPSLEEVVQMLLEHAKLQLEYKGEYTGIREMRKHAAWYTAGYKNSAKLRGRINGVETFEELEELFLNLP
jgi:nifR3 family TIM-barrel protein